MNKKSKGFTLVELIIVIAVIGVLAAILIPTFANVIDKANSKSAMSDAKNSLTIYQSHFTNDVGTVQVDGLVIRVHKANKDYYYNNTKDGLVENTALESVVNSVTPQFITIATNADGYYKAEIEENVMMGSAANKLYPEAEMVLVDRLPKSVALFASEHAIVFETQDDINRDNAHVEIVENIGGVISDPVVDLPVPEGETEPTKVGSTAAYFNEEENMYYLFTYVSETDMQPYMDFDKETFEEWLVNKTNDLVISGITIQGAKVYHNPSPLSALNSALNQVDNSKKVELSSIAENVLLLVPAHA